MELSGGCPSRKRSPSRNTRLATVRWSRRATTVVVAAFPFLPLSFPSPPHYARMPSSPRKRGFLVSRDTPFIAVEGIDGVGKSTQVRLLAERLERDGRATLTVREPGGTELGEQVRKILLESSTPLEVEAELLLFMASRVQLFEEKIAPALADGRVVISDRFHLSSIVYQGIARGLGQDRTSQIVWGVLGDRRPSCNVVLTLPLEDCVARLGAAGDRFESQPDVLAAVWRGFQETEGLPGDRIVRVDAGGTPEEVAARVFEGVASAI